MHKMLSQIRGGGWLTNERMAGYAWILLTCELLGFAFFVAGTHGLIVKLHNPTSSDFVSFYAAGRLADAGTGWLAYDHAAHYAAEQQATEPGIGYNYFYYPPVFLLICEDRLGCRIFVRSLPFRPAAWQRACLPCGRSCAT